MKKSKVVSASLLAAAALVTIACDDAHSVHLDASGHCVTDQNRIIDQRVCYGYGGGYYGGAHYIYVPHLSAPYYQYSYSPGYVRPWTASSSGFGGYRPVPSPSVSTGTVRGFFGGSASASS